MSSHVSSDFTRSDVPLYPMNHSAHSSVSNEEVIPAIEDAETKSAQELSDFIQKRNVSQRYVPYIHNLKGVHFVGLISDNESMGVKGKFTSQSSWETGCQISGDIIDVATIYDPKGLDVSFLFRDEMKGVTKREEFFHIRYGVKPEGKSTPLGIKLNGLLEKYRNYENGVHIIITINNLPDDFESKEDGANALIGCLNKMKDDPQLKKISITFVVLSEDQRTLNFYYSLLQSYSNLDVIREYNFEIKNKINEYQRLSFSYADWTVLTMLRARVPQLREVDNTQGCCSLM